MMQISDLFKKTSRLRGMWKDVERLCPERCMMALLNFLRYNPCVF